MENNLTSTQLTSGWLTSAQLTSAQLTAAKLTSTLLTSGKLTAAKITAAKITAAQLTSGQLTNNLYKTIDLRDIPVRCSGICCDKFFNPDGKIVGTPCTSLCFACPDEMFAPRSIKPLPDWTY